MKHDETSLISDLSWLSVKCSIDGETDKAEQAEKRAQALINHYQTGQDWETIRLHNRDEITKKDLK